MPDPSIDDVPDEDAKLVVLARASRARLGAAEGAAVRDEDGRTYAAATVTLISLPLTALQAAVAAAASSGVRHLAAAAVVADGAIPDEPALAEVGCTRLIVADLSGRVREIRRP